MVRAAVQRAAGRMVARIAHSLSYDPLCWKVASLTTLRTGAAGASADDCRAVARRPSRVQPSRLVNSPTKLMLMRRVAHKSKHSWIPVILNKSVLPSVREACQSNTVFKCVCPGTLVPGPCEPVHSFRGSASTVSALARRYDAVCGFVCVCVCTLE